MGESCPACALFGAGGQHAHIGLVSFGDAVLPKGQRTEMRRLAPLYAPRVAFRRVPKVYTESRGGFRGRKFYYHALEIPVAEGEGDQCEVIPPGATLGGSLSFANLDAANLGVLLFALGLDGSFRLKLGGGKPLAFGSIALVAQDLTLVKGQSFLEAERSTETRAGDKLAEFVNDQIAAAERGGRLLPEQMNKLREILHYPSQRHAPTGMY